MVAFEGNELLLTLLPEPVCHLKLTGTKQDIETVVQQSGFKPTALDDRPGPSWWRPATGLGPEARTYTRVHRPRNPNSRLAIGGNRIWNEYLWVDETGTNAYFLLWGI